MAKFLKIHLIHERVAYDEDGKMVTIEDPKELTVDIEKITVVYENERLIELTQGLPIRIKRDNEWEKIMSFVKANEL